MVNDLKISSPDTKMWKFEDDSTVSEHLTGNTSSVTQPTLNLVESWCSKNWMILNPIKCKGLRICYLKRSVEFQPLTIAGRELEIVQSHKALGLTVVIYRPIDPDFQGSAERRIIKNSGRRIIKNSGRRIIISIE
jgi:hypothetical protein